MQIRKYAPDPAVTSVGLTNPNSASSSFNANGYASNGDVQSYYLRWSGSTPSASANGNITD